MGNCMSSRIETGHLLYELNYNIEKDDCPIPAVEFFDFEILEKKLEKQFRFYKNRNRKFKNEYKQKIKEHQQEQQKQQQQQQNEYEKKEEEYQDIKNKYKINNKDNNVLNELIYENYNTNTNINYCNGIGCDKIESINKIHLNKFNSLQIRRSSSLNYDEICTHCEHNHLYNCCQYYYDTTEDAIGYALFKINLEKPRDIQIQNLKWMPDALCGQLSTTYNPKWTYKNPKIYKNLKPSRSSSSSSSSLAVDGAESSSTVSILIKKIQNYFKIENDNNRKKKLRINWLRRIFKFRIFNVSKGYWEEKRITFERISIQFFRILMIVA